MKIAVLGGGNGSFAAAADFTLGGHEVALYRRNQSDVDAHIASGGAISLIDGRGQRRAEIALITSDLAAALRGAELVLCPTPAFAQDDLAHRVAPLLEAGQVVYLPPGSFGSYIFAKAAHAAGRSGEVAFAETGTLPWLARKQGAYTVRISGRGVRLPTGVFPLSGKTRALEVISRAFPKAIEDCGDILSGSGMRMLMPMAAGSARWMTRSMRASTWRGHGHWPMSSRLAWSMATTVTGKVATLRGHSAWCTCRHISPRSPGSGVMRPTSTGRGLSTSPISSATRPSRPRRRSNGSRQSWLAPWSPRWSTPAGPSSSAAPPATSAT